MQEGGVNIASWLEKNPSNWPNGAPVLFPSSLFMVEAMVHQPELRHLAEESILRNARDDYLRFPSQYKYSGLKQQIDLFVKRGIVDAGAVKETIRGVIVEALEKWKNEQLPRKDFIRKQYAGLSQLMDVAGISKEEFPEVVKLIEPGEETFNQFWGEIAHWREWIETGILWYETELKKGDKDPDSKMSQELNFLHHQEGLALAIDMQRDKGRVEQWLKDHAATADTNETQMQTLVSDLFPSISFEQLPDWGLPAVETRYALDELAGKPGQRQYSY